MGLNCLSFGRVFEAFKVKKRIVNVKVAGFVASSSSSLGGMLFDHQNASWENHRWAQKGNKNFPTSFGWDVLIS